MDRNYVDGEGSKITCQKKRKIMLNILNNLNLSENFLSGDWEGLGAWVPLVTAVVVAL